MVSLLAVSGAMAETIPPSLVLIAIRVGDRLRHAPSGPHDPERQCG